MTEGIIGKKLGMTQVFREGGKAEAVTAIEAGPCTIVQVKTAEKDGYEAAKLGFGRALVPKMVRRAADPLPDDIDVIAVRSLPDDIDVIAVRSLPEALDVALGSVE